MIESAITIDDFFVLIRNFLSKKNFPEQKEKNIFLAFTTDILLSEKANSKYFSRPFLNLSHKIKLSYFYVLRLHSQKADKTNVPSITWDRMFALGILEKKLKQLFYFICKIRRYPFSNIEYFAWKQILKIYQPKFLVGHQPSKEACFAANRYNIQTYDLQHGAIYPKHWWYLKEREKEKKEFFPTGFICWDYESANYLKKIKVPKKLFVIGNTLSKNIRPENKNLKTAKPKIGITLSYQMYKDNFHNHKNLLDKKIVDFCTNNTKFLVTLRFHPAYFSNKAKQEFNRFKLIYKNSILKKVKLSNPESESIDEFVYKNDIHLTETSSSYINFALQNKKTIFIGGHLKFYDAMPRWYFKNKLVFICRKSEDLEKKIFKILRENKTIKTIPKTEYYHNLKKLVNELS